MSSQRTSKPSDSPKKPRKQRKKTDAISASDFILVDLVGRTQDDNRVFDTTKEEIAKKEGIYSEDEVYGPRLVVVGRGWVLPGLDEALQEMKVGETRQVTLPPEKAFGIRDPKKVRILSRAKFPKTETRLAPGVRVRVGSQYGTVRRVASGRVTVDFNPPLAGRTILYEVTILQKLTKPLEKLQALIRRRFFNIDPQAIQVSARACTVTVTLPSDPRLLLNRSLQIQKLGVAHDIETYLKDTYSKLLFVEEWSVGRQSDT